MNKQRMTGIALAAWLAASAGSALGSGAADECGRIGAWTGEGGGFAWTATDTPGTVLTAGQVTFDWIAVPPNLFAYGANRLSSGVGVWEMTRPGNVNFWQGDYRFTFLAYGLADNAPVQQPVYKLRISGELTQRDCNRADIVYNVEFFIPPTNPVPIVIGPPSAATETRILLR